MSDDVVTKIVYLLSAVAVAGLGWLFSQLHLVDATVNAQTVALILGIGIPFVTAYATKLNASPWLKTLVAVVLAALGTVSASVVGLKGAASLSGLVTAFVLALISAGATRISLTGHVVSAIAEKTPNKGLGASTAKAA